MTAQVPADKGDQVMLSPEEWATYSTLKRYTRPTKTKFLARTLRMDRTKAVELLNGLKDKNLIYWHVPHRFDEKRYYGWKAL